MSKGVLFNRYEAKTQIGNDYSDQLRRFLLPWFQDASNRGFSLIEMTAIAHQEVSVCSSEAILQNAIIMRKEDEN